jgi:rhodanese-related sulfurtransferase
MSALNAITSDKLFRLIGTHNCPAIIDVRTDDDFAARPFLIPGAARRRFDRIESWFPDFAGRPSVVYCHKGGGISAGVAAWLRARGLEAEILEGGMTAWSEAGLPAIPEASLPPRDELGRTLWVTRARPKVDRIACPWLIQRFVDRNATFLFVSPADIDKVVERFGATAFDVEGVHWSHRGDQCTFDTMVDGLGLTGFEALQRLAVIVRGADTGQPELAPQCAGLLAASLGLSRMYADDLEQLDAGMVLYDALYRWCRDATDETHDWVSHAPKARKRR